VWLDDGSSTVYANGTGDAVVATKEGQTIYGGTLATASLSVVLLPNSDGTANGNDLVSAGAGTTTVFDSSSNNTVLAGSGNLYFVAAANTSASVVSGTGNVYAFGGDGGSTTLSGAAGTAYYVASTGNETLIGAGFNGALYAYGGDSTSNDSFTGGNGRDVFTAGSGNETFTGGTGGDIYQFVSSESAGTSITITDFGAGSNNTVILNGFTAQDLATLTSGGTEAGGNYTVTTTSLVGPPSAVTSLPSKPFELAAPALHREGQLSSWPFFSQGDLRLQRAQRCLGKRSTRRRRIFLGAKVFASLYGRGTFSTAG
jgi:Ca2+-binding RTX toxin-like protein